MDTAKDRFILFCSILDFGKGSKALRLSKELGALGGTIFLGRGTIRNELLKMLGAVDIRREIFIAMIEESKEDEFYENMLKKFHLDKPHHGIAFSLPIKYCEKIDEDKYISNPEKEGVKKVGYDAIFIIVNKGYIDDVLDAAEAAGSTGGTVIHGRGAGAYEKAKLFNIEIEPEKDILLILSKKEKTEAIINSVRDKLKIEEQGKGIIFVLDVSRTVGLYEGD
ncbi:MAG TPA: P-II family nitrogen regulator [Tissierellaceae bacterium]